MNAIYKPPAAASVDLGTKIQTSQYDYCSIALGYHMIIWVLMMMMIMMDVLACFLLDID